MMNRRDVLNLAVSAGTATLVLPSAVRAANHAEQSPPFRIVDTNASLFHWPFRRLPLDTLDALLKKYRLLGISQAWAGSFEGVLHRDLASVNQRLAEACRKYPEFVPIGSVNPELPSWQTDLKCCFEKHQMPAIRLHPNYHGYSLDDPRFTQLLKLATEAGRFVQIAVSLEDTRTQHPMLQVPDVNLTPLADIVKSIPDARVQLLNYRPRSPVLDQLARTPGVYFETARVDGTDGIPNLVKSVSADRVLFGTHAPFLIPEAALIRVHESDQLDEPSLRAISSGNADTLLRTVD